MTKHTTLTFNGGRSSLKATPQRLIEILHDRDTIKTPTAKQFRAALQRCKDKRDYPAVGVTTAEYVQEYYAINAHRFAGYVSGQLDRNEKAAAMVRDLFGPLGTSFQYPQPDTVEESI